MKSENGKAHAIVFVVTFIIIGVVFGWSVIKTNIYNNTERRALFPSNMLFSSEVDLYSDISVRASARSSTWYKLFDFNNEGLTENNYQAFTYDFTVSNKTKDEVSEFSFKLTFGHDIYLTSAWNGGLEIHQNVTGNGVVAMIPDLRDYDPADYPLDVKQVDGESLVLMKAGDYLIYYPSSSMNAMEVPIKPYEGTTPGLILYMSMMSAIAGSN